MIQALFAANVCDNHWPDDKGIKTIQTELLSELKAEMVIIIDPMIRGLRLLPPLRLGCWLYLW